MFKIAHRGNVSGITEMENHPDYIDTAIGLGYDVEIDVWDVFNTFALGHDVPQYEIDLDFLLSRQNSLWCHAKNLGALYKMLDCKIHCFWQQNDDYAITSRGFIFTHSSIAKKTDRSILVSLDGTLDVFGASGVCSDFV